MSSTKPRVSQPTSIRRKNKREEKAEFEVCLDNHSSTLVEPQSHIQQPVWASEPTDEDTPIKLDKSRSTSWSSATDLVFNNRGEVALKAQSVPIKELLHKVIYKMRGDTLFNSAFLDVGNRIQYSRQALYRCARDLGLVDVKNRIKDDQSYSRYLATIVRHSSFDSSSY